MAYYRFVKCYEFFNGYGVIAKCPIALTKKDGFIWNPQAQIAFEKFLEAMTQLPVLAIPNFSKPFVLEIDASNIGIGAILHRKVGH